MAYVRGKLYVWSSEDHIHLWSEALTFDASQYPEQFACGVTIERDTFEEIVAMLHAEMHAEGRLEAARERAYRRWGGNLGCIELAEELGQPTAMDRLDAALKEREQQEQDP